MIRFLTSTVLSSLVLSQEVKLIDESFRDTPPELLSAAKLLTSLRTDPDEIPTPVILWHGMGDRYNSYFSMGSMKRLIEKEIPGVYRVVLIKFEIQEVEMSNSVHFLIFSSFYMFLWPKAIFFQNHSVSPIFMHWKRPRRRFKMQRSNRYHQRIFRRFQQNDWSRL